MYIYLKLYVTIRSLFGPMQACPAGAPAGEPRSLHHLQESQWLHLLIVPSPVNRLHQDCGLPEGKIQHGSVTTKAQTNHF